MEELQIAKIQIYPHIYTLPSFYSRSHIYGSGSNKNETNTIQETRELTEQEKNIAKVGLITIGIVFIICIIAIAVWIYKIWKE